MGLEMDDGGVGGYKKEELRGSLLKAPASTLIDAKLECGPSSAPLVLHLTFETKCYSFTGVR